MYIVLGGSLCVKCPGSESSQYSLTIKTICGRTGNYVLTRMHNAFLYICAFIIAVLLNPRGKFRP
jgi:hypothetical protein